MDIEFGWTAHAALQFGNLAVMASWLDVTSKQDVRHCFQYNRAEGVLGVLHQEGNKKQYYGIQDRFAVLQMEDTENTSSYSQRFSKVTEPLTGNLRVDLDDSSC